VTTRHGTPRNALPFLALAVGLPLALLVQGVWLLRTASLSARGGHHTYDFGLVVTGALIAIAGAVALTVVSIMLLRNPRRALRTIDITPTDLLLPSGPRWRRVPVAEVSGVGLGAATTGGWGIMIWRIDGTHTRMAGPGLATRDVEPGRSPVAGMAREIHARILELQGPNGPLLTRAQQRQPDLDPDTRISRLWDPVDGTQTPTVIAPAEAGPS